MAVASSTVLLSATGFAADHELLANRGFESGNLTGWLQTVGPLQGHVVTVSGPAGMPCARISPNTPHGGSYLFSSSVQDGATPSTPEITIAQEIDVSSFAGVATGEASIFASGYFSGAAGCNENPSNDTAQIVVEFYSGGVSGTLLDTASSPVADPFVGVWNFLSVGDDVPQATDTIVLRVRTVLDPGFASIDIGVDDMSLVLSSPIPVPALDSRSIGILVVLVAIAGLFPLYPRATERARAPIRRSRTPTPSP
jgi:hypothetical protein